VIGISSDSVSSHEQFASQLHLPFILVSDTGGAVRKVYGIPNTLGLWPGRVTYVIDKQGIIRHIFSSATQIDKHISEAAQTVRQLQTEQG
jgi:peroxiredoxin Q/BCP